MKLKTLYKKNARGNISQWTVIAEDNSYWTEFGDIGGAVKKSDKTYCQGKNIGKVNETDDKTQAMLEAEALWRKKIEREGFRENIDDVENISFEPPMLAKKFDGEYKDDMKFIQPKLDGIRCNISIDDNGIVNAVSRHNLKFYSTFHIEDNLREILIENPHIHFDGELYNHELHDDFNKIVSLVKKIPNDNERQEIETKVKYYVYDLWDDTNKNLTFEERNLLIKELLKDIDNIVIVPTFEIKNREDIEYYFNEFRNNGYEGAIIRKNGPYEHKRSNNLLKYKEFLDEEFEIISINIGKNNTIAESVTIKLDNDKQCNATLAFSNDKCKEIWENKEKYIGKMATVCYFGKTQSGMLRFPIVKIIDRNEIE